MTEKFRELIGDSVEITMANALREQVYQERVSDVCRIIEDADCLKKAQNDIYAIVNAIRKAAAWLNLRPTSIDELRAAVVWEIAEDSQLTEHCQAVRTELDAVLTEYTQRMSHLAYGCNRADLAHNLAMQFEAHADLQGQLENILCRYLESLQPKQERRYA